MSFTIRRQEDAEVITLDATMSESYSPSISTTEHPVERGSDITDHARANPLTFSIRALVTETPFANMEGSAGYQRIDDVLSFLRASEGKLVDIVSTRIGTIENCLITGYPHDVSIARNLPFNISFKQVRIDNSQTVIIAPRQAATAVNPMVTDEIDAGLQPTKEDTSKKAEEAGSTAYTLIKAGARRLRGS
jgi:hypothetical protein